MADDGEDKNKISSLMTLGSSLYWIQFPGKKERLECARYKSQKKNLLPNCHRGGASGKTLPFVDLSEPLDI